MFVKLTNVSSDHVMPLALFASVYENPSTWPVLRPNRPCKLGPILLPSAASVVWHWAHRVCRMLGSDWSGWQKIESVPSTLKRFAPFFTSPEIRHCKHLFASACTGQILRLSSLRCSLCSFSLLILYVPGGVLTRPPLSAY